jgi:hypothetical protein
VGEGDCRGGAPVPAQSSGIVGEGNNYQLPMPNSHSQLSTIIKSLYVKIKILYQLSPICYHRSAINDLLSTIDRQQSTVLTPTALASTVISSTIFLCLVASIARTSG